MQLESFRIADQLQAGLLKLDSRLRKSTEAAVRRTGSALRTKACGWTRGSIKQKTALTTPNEKAVLSEINAAYDGYLAVAREIAADAASFDKFKVEAAEERLISLGLKLANAHREALGRFVASTQQSLALLQAVIFTALLALVLLATWAAAVVYREMIAPLRVKLHRKPGAGGAARKARIAGVLAAGVAHEIRNPLTAIKARLYTEQKALAPGLARAHGWRVHRQGD